MNAEAEFNALVSMYQSVIQDIKITYPAWENVCQKAHKLSTQLKSTLACINSFVDAVQVVGDAANNLKGSTRDIGACLTRFCMRQRSLENRLRSLADALTDELAMSIQSKCSQWKQKINEMDRHSAKFCKRVRSRKGAIDISTVNEQRRLCRHLLTEQRSQLSFFISALLPCLNSQLNLMDEGGHVRQVAEHLQSTVRSVDTASLIDTILSDLHHGADYAWRNCLSSNTQRDFMQTSFKAESFAIRASSPCPSNATWPTVSEGCLPGMSKSTPSTFPTNTVSSSSSEVGRRLAITQKTFIPLSPCRFPLTKPPLPRKVVSASSPVPTVIPDFNNVHSDQASVRIFYYFDR
ncbi:hypothetical protein AB6A40_009976 [Gnathostoma spinigerum]|uniref:IMD domain-containing protein n=1 Tax=Gnathostoma spinigerum TaxID=75299 RepID=A0ABD6F1L6_9BILA